MEFLQGSAEDEGPHGYGDNIHLKMYLSWARLVEYTISFLITIVVSLFVILKVRCQLQDFSYYVMGILIFSQLSGFTGQLLLVYCYIEHENIDDKHFKLVKQISFGL
jgi:hypothetical protein